MQRIYLGNGDGTFQAPYDATENAADFGYMNWTSTNSVVTDWNGNGWPDNLFGTKLGTSNDTGAVLVFLNDCPDVATSPPTPCSRNPQFKPQRSRPVWYPTLSPDERSGVDDFLARHRDRPVLVLVGSRSGMLHAFRSRPNAIAAPDSGEEAWAFIPARIAPRLEADMTSGQVSAYPDGSPTLADIRGPDGELMTLAVVNGGKGSRSVFALDVTETIDSTTGEVRGPTPLWDAIPGGADAGQARANPVVIRSLVDDAERFIAVLGSGPAHGDPDHPYNRGRDLLAVDAATGDELWRFRAACTLTSDISAFEQSEPVGDQEEEPAPGFIDRVAFADACGNVYLLDPGADVDGGYLDSSELGTLDTGDVDPDGRPVRAVFSTVATPGALGGERPIAGTIGARPDATGRTVLFFGTGGFASFDPGLQNAFYAVYADTGEIPRPRGRVHPRRLRKILRRRGGHREPGLRHPLDRPARRLRAV